MPKRDVHVNTGMVCGAGLAMICAQNQKPEQFIIETLGGIAGGYIGGRLPDIIEPATSPRHRDSAHSIAAGGGIIKFGNIQLCEWQQACREKATEAQERRKAQIPGSLKEFGCYLLEMFCQALAGAIAGLERVRNFV